jgi:hypothetical protein
MRRDARFFDAALKTRCSRPETALSHHTKGWWGAESKAECQGFFPSWGWILVTNELSSSDLQTRLLATAEALQRAEERATAGQLALELMHEVKNPLEALGHWSARLEMCQWIRENWTRRAYGTRQEVPT